MIDDKMLQYLFINICDTIQREQRYRSFRQKNHICILFDKKKIYSIGVNYTVQNGSIHSEMDAFNRLEFNNKKTPKKIHMLVVRVCYEHESEKKHRNTNRTYHTYSNKNKYTHKKSINCNCSSNSDHSDSIDCSDSTDSSQSSDDELLPSLAEPSLHMNDKITNMNYLIQQIQKSNHIFDGIRFRISKPCYHCIQHIKQSCIYKNYIVKKVYYTIDINYLYETNIDDILVQPHISSYYKMLNSEIFWNSTINEINIEQIKLRNRFYK